MRYFEFRNNFWINLHHTLFREAVVAKMSAETRAKSGLTPLDEAGASEQERRAWEDAVRYYASAFKGKRLLFDDQLVGINDWLGRDKDAEKLLPEGLPKNLVDCLEKAAPIYRAHWWQEHERANKQFINEIEPKVAELAPEVIPQLEYFLGMKWLMEPLPVDVTYYVAEVGGAYTTEHPGHTTVASGREDNHGPAGVETLFHEGAHTLTDKLASALDAECAQQKKECADLWHAVQFYTVGAVVKKALAEHGVPEYVPYAYKFGLFDRGTWPKFRPALEHDWQLYLDGKTSLQQAIVGLVRDIQAGKSGDSKQP